MDNLYVLTKAILVPVPDSRAWGLFSFCMISHKFRNVA